MLENKKILLFCQYFFNYENKIKGKMEELGAKVDLYNEMSIKSTRDRALLKISSQFFKKRTEKYYFNILSEVVDNVYDYVLFIDCEMPTEDILSMYRKKMRQAKFCLHMWDSVENLKGISKKFKYFDLITTFDRKDAKKHGLILRPLFFCDEYRKKDNNIVNFEYDISFVGTIHSDRYKILKKIIKQAEYNSLKVYFYPYLQSRFIYYFYRIIKSEFRHTSIQDFKFEKVLSKDIVDIINKSKVVVDIQHPAQSGLTMRTLEMIGMKKKLITTNKDVTEYDLYNQNNIMIIDRTHPVLDFNFFKAVYKELEKDKYEYYSLGRWCLDVLGVGEC